ncbi:DUF3021 family protein [Lacticaseibacillus kribbianus]|uniref:DUF3021 family protein n=1 Tax=Lacticaseibacillus kribbianus TaxID=2926292 RepID=UPI001CD72B01|nr:DUF3021 family protein [Lacticaseibacillus kribbianus]
MIVKALIRGGIPLVLLGGIAWVLHNQGSAQDARSTLFAGLIAGVVGAASVLYEVSGWSLAKQSAAHLLAMLATVYPLLLVSGWFRVASLGDALVVLLLFGLVGLVLWLVMFLLAKWRAR